MIYDVGFMILYVLGEMLNYVLTCKVVFRAKMTENKLKFFGVILALISLHLIVLKLAGEENAKGIAFFSMCLVPIFLFDKFRIRNVLSYPFVVFGISTLQVAISFFMAYLLNIPEFKIIDDRILGIICEIGSLSLLLIIYVVQKIKKVDNQQINISARQYIVLYIMVICIMSLLGSIQAMSRYLDKEYINEIGFSASGACVLLVIVSVWQIQSSNRANKLQQQKLLVEQQMELQKEYYNQLFKQDKKMRKFRHDFNAHMSVLKQYCDEKSILKMKEYLENIVDGTTVEDAQVFTRNPEIDTIINSFMDIIKEEGIVFSVRGCISQEVDITAYEMCSLVYNLLKNAVEACQKIDDISNRRIIFEVGTYYSGLFMSVGNTISFDLDTNNYNMKTSKADKTEHGFGTDIVKDIVNKYNGRLESKCENNWFEVQVNIG